ELVKGIISMIRALGAEVVAEGVETLEQACMLRAYGCRFLQGYLIGKPRPEAELPELLRSTRPFA
ncbi:MAG: EAL domain-containing protein, partial [Xanthomonadales bacterium]|nr:EAL domain-containing protein [Xanthomonadales bacterium]